MDEYYYVVFCILMSLFGLCIGSFLNVVIYRFPLKMRLDKPASHCPQCDHKLAWYDNIPLLSYIMLRGKCRYCGCHISFRYFFVELLNCTLWTLFSIFFYEQGIFFCILNCLAISVLICMALVDYDHMFIPDTFQIILAVLAIILVFVDKQIPYSQKLYGLLLGGGFFGLFYLLSFVVFKREGLGFGDVKLMAAAGLLLGIKNTAVAIILSVFVALIFVLAKSKMKKKEFPFAPFLVLGILISLFVGSYIFDGYMSLFGF